MLILITTLISADMNSAFMRATYISSKRCRLLFSGSNVVSEVGVVKWVTRKKCCDVLTFPNMFLYSTLSSSSSFIIFVSPSSFVLLIFRFSRFYNFPSYGPLCHLYIKILHTDSGRLYQVIFYYDPKLTVAVECILFPASYSRRPGFKWGYPDSCLRCLFSLCGIISTYVVRKGRPDFSHNSCNLLITSRFPILCYILNWIFGVRGE